jgi:shikimate dehydrogenase
MKRVALIGYPLGHSVSPAMHNAAFRKLGLDWKYEARPTPPEELPRAVAALRKDPWAGANITVPYKEDVLPLLDEVSPHATALGAVNTICSQGGQLVGENTDMEGFRADLDAHCPTPSDGTTVVLGAGGAARAVAFAVARGRVDLRLICRREPPGRQIAAAVRAQTGVEMRLFPWEQASFLAIPTTTALIVNATPLGMHPHSDACPWPAAIPFPDQAFVYDLVYNPTVTRLVQMARAQGLGAATGLGMLVEQGALAFERWTGLPAPRETMGRAAKQTLEADYA